MKNIYNSLITALTNKSRNIKLFTTAFIFLVGMMPGRSWANVTITAPSLTVYACGGTFPTNPNTLGNNYIS